MQTAYKLTTCVAASVTLLAASGAKAESARPPAALPPEVQKFINETALASIPRTHEDDRHWNKQKEIKLLPRVRFDNGRLTSKRPRKQVNHGTWHRYRLELIDPERNLRTKILNIGSSKPGRTTFQVEITARLRGHGRAAYWQRGVQLASLSAAVETGVLLRFDCVLTTRFEGKKIPPDIVFEPRVTDGDIKLRDFRIRQISKLRGSLAEKFSGRIRELVQDRLEKRKPKIIAKINASIAKRQDKLRISPSKEIGEELSKWKVALGISKKAAGATQKQQPPPKANATAHSGEAPPMPAAQDDSGRPEVDAPILLPEGPEPPAR